MQGEGGGGEGERRTWEGRGGAGEDWAPGRRETGEDGKGVRVTVGRKGACRREKRKVEESGRRGSSEEEEEEMIKGRSTTKMVGIRDRRGEDGNGGKGQEGKGGGQLISRGR